MFARPIFSYASPLMVAAALHAQFSPTPFQAPPEALAALHVASGTAQDLALPQSSAMPFQVRVHIAGAERTLLLQPRDVCSSDFQLLVHDASGVHPVSTPASVTFRGSVGDLPGAQVAASLIDGQLFATVHTGDGEIWGIQPLSEFIPSLPRAPHVVYRGSDVALPDGAHCGVAHDLGKPVGHHFGPAALKVAEIAIDADLAYYNRYGANVVNVFNRVTTVMNSCNVIYGRDCEIEHLITAILVRTTNIYTWNGDLPNLFGQFRAYWNANHGAIRRDMAHLFTGEGTFNGVVGYAAVSAVCNIANAYGSSKAYSNLALSTGLVSHEMGHNWGAGHCNNAPPCNIMCSTIGGCAGLGRFSPGEIAIIVGFKNSRTCLSDPTRPTLVPAGNYNMEGHSAVALPFNNNNMILQQLMPPADVGLANGAVISSLTFLRESNLGNGNVDFNVQPFILDRVEIRLENTTTASLSTTAANNTHWTGGSVPTPRHVRFAPVCPRLHVASGDGARRHELRAVQPGPAAHLRQHPESAAGSPQRRHEPDRRVAASAGQHH